MTGPSRFAKKNQKVRKMVKSLHQRSNSTQESSNFFVIAEVKLYFVMMEGYVLYYSDVCFAPVFFIPP